MRRPAEDKAARPSDHKNLDEREELDGSEGHDGPDDEEREDIDGDRE